MFLTKPTKSSIRDHCNTTNHGLKIYNFSILDSTFYSQDLRILKSLNILKLRPQINEYQSAVQLNAHI